MSNRLADELTVAGEQRKEKGFSMVPVVCLETTTMVVMFHFKFTSTVLIHSR